MVSKNFNANTETHLKDVVETLAIGEVNGRHRIEMFEIWPTGEIAHAFVNN